MSEQLPRITHRAEQPYAAIRGVVTMRTFGEIADRMGEVFGWLGARGVEPAGAPFFRYNRIGAEDVLEVEAGVPVEAPVAGEGDVLAGVLPAGRYVEITHTGHPDDLLAITEDLLAWAADRGLAWDVEDSPEGELWGCRLEVFLTDPTVEPDMAKWETALAFRLAD
ncbi:GyrI-like domain-containing protein [Umezawaea sp.]|uniref:GyrI-like domain-containing protein n=1 Tax=Umezawaea sp. TaxID=1955258 RepID=UPI002ED0F2DD